ncbi:MAG TPA: acyl-CoA dehydrogenase [Acidimicrobiia bacterium]
MTSGHYRGNLRDIRFNLFEVNRFDDYTETAPFALDPATARLMLEEVEKMATGDFGASFTDADRHPPELIDGEVRLPESLKRSLDAYYGGGWHRFSMPPDMGGAAAPPSLHWAMQEMWAGSNPTAYLTAGTSLMARVIAQEGTPQQHDFWSRLMIERPWGGTMVLTEADAGSDVGAGTTKAIHVEGDQYHLEGVKRFITSGDNDYFENIVHLVLARAEGAVAGTKGLSMFIVPKYLVNEDETLGRRNGYLISRIEEKMGIKSSATCEMVFGQDDPCVGYLVGGVHEGIRQMFRVIEYGRMLIGAKSMATLSSGYLHALDFAKDRIQGPDLTRATDQTAPRVPIIRHPDVRRMLMLQKAYVEGLRALYYYTAWAHDQSLVGPEGESWRRRVDLLLPLVKGYSSEKAYVLLGQSLQVLGGSGFTSDYPIEQYIRDVKIDSLYEGTTGIQALDLFFRKVIRDRGKALQGLLADILEFVKGGEAEDTLSRERELLGEALDSVQGQVGAMASSAMASMQEPGEIYKAGLHTSGFLESLAELVIGWLLLRHAEVALVASPSASDADAAFYEGKVAAARFFVRNCLPQARLRRVLAEEEDGSLMELPVAAF